MSHDEPQAVKINSYKEKILRYFFSCLQLKDGVCQKDTIERLSVHKYIFHSIYLSSNVTS